MPIYAYRCRACNHEKDILQKIADAPLTRCPACGKETFSKQVTAAGFQLKGTGWYVTDFRDRSASKAAQKKPESESGEAKTDISGNAGENAGGKEGKKEGGKAASTDQTVASSPASEAKSP